ncbi:MAG TPA: RHS repeat-associated core domain-containing protein, partial [Pirellulales bacterium]|nr:RHS repeat-associated core domain-containing protein [Pirellulales bacterium]
YRFLNGPGAAGVDAVMGEEAITTQGSAGTTTYALADNLGSVRDIVNTSSVVVDHIVYNSFGNVVAECGTVAHWAGYAGYHPDANTGLDYADHRWYDPAVGRWISEDPLGFGGGDTNVSRYVGNSATNRVDPRGLQPPNTPANTPDPGWSWTEPPKPPAVLGFHWVKVWQWKDTYKLETVTWTTWDLKWKPVLQTWIYPNGKAVTYTYYSSYYVQTPHSRSIETRVPKKEYKPWRKVPDPPQMGIGGFGRGGGVPGPVRPGAGGAGIGIWINRGGLRRRGGGSRGGGRGFF